MYAFIYSDGYSVRVDVESYGTAGFPFLSVPKPYNNAWEAAIDWAHSRGVTEYEIRTDSYNTRPQQWEADRV